MILNDTHVPSILKRQILCSTADSIWPPPCLAPDASIRMQVGWCPKSKEADEFHFVALPTPHFSASVGTGAQGTRGKSHGPIARLGTMHPGTTELSSRRGLQASDFIGWSSEKGWG